MVNRGVISPIEQHIWQLAGRQPNAAWQMPKGFRLFGALNANALKAAFYRVLKSHSSLQTLWLSNGKTAAPVLVDRIDLESIFTTHDFSNHLHPFASAMQRFDLEEQLPFYLAEELPIRLQLLRLDDQDHVLLITAHQIAFDLFSWTLFWNALCENYELAIESNLKTNLVERFTTNNLPNNTLLTREDIAQHELALLHTDEGAACLAHWQKLLQSNVEPTTRHHIYSHLREEGSEVAVRIDAKSRHAIETLRRRFKSTNQAVFLALFAKLLHTQQIENGPALYAAPTTRRLKPELEQAIAPLAGTNLFLFEAKASDTLDTLIEKATHEIRRAWGYMQVPAEAALHAANTTEQQHSVPYCLNIDDQKTQSWQPLGSTKCQQLFTKTRTAKHDITLSLNSSPEGISGRIEFSLSKLSTNQDTELALGFKKLIEEYLP
ncbi:MAG: hypothetical protein HC848_00235 [Limnobacter sp.]|nr:hypothetical protein [Limnobacter sp.]